MEKRRKGPPRKGDTQVVEFNGVVYRRRPGKKYYETNLYDKARKKLWTDSLHRAMWRAAHGDIPPGHDIHHVDGDHNNNVLENLECIPKAEHARRHNAFAGFNASPEFREHHKRIVKLAWANAPYRKYACLECGKDFESRRINLPPKFCSKRCCGIHNRRLRLARLRPGS